MKRRTSDVEDNDGGEGGGGGEYLDHHSLSNLDMEDVEAALLLMHLGSPKVDLGSIPASAHSFGQKMRQGELYVGSLDHNYWNMSGVSPESGIEACSPATPSPPSQEVAMITALGARMGNHSAINSHRIKKRMRDLRTPESRTSGEGDDSAMDPDGGATTFNFPIPMEKIEFNFNQETIPKITTSGNHRRGTGRGEMRKCRKVYGMQGRDSWCTQCKWKKACTRFTGGSKSLLQPHQPGTTNSSKQSNNTNKSNASKEKK